MKLIDAATSAQLLARFALRKPDLRDTVEHAVDLAWLSSVWILRERLSGNGSMIDGQLFGDARVARHLELLQAYTRSALLDTSDWSSSDLIADFLESTNTLASATEEQTDKLSLRLLHYLSGQLSFYLDKQHSITAKGLVELSDVSLQLFFLFELEMSQATPLSDTFEDWLHRLEPVPPSLDNGIERALAFALERAKASSVA